MDFQYIAVLLIVAGAIAYGAIMLLRKRRSFSLKRACADDCGCSGGSKKLT